MEEKVLVNANPHIVFAFSLRREVVSEAAHEPFGKDKILWFFGFISDILSHVVCNVHCLEEWMSTLRCF